MAFKIKDGLRIGTVDVLNNTATQLKLKDYVDGSHTAIIQSLNLNADRTYELPNNSGTFALTSDVGVNTDTTYSISTEVGDDAYSEKIRLSAGGSGTGTDDVILAVGAVDAVYGLTIEETGDTITFKHADTSSQASVDNSGRTYIQDITLDTYGHITAITSASETVVDTNTTYDISSVTTTGGAFLRLTAGGSGSGTDDVKLASGTNTTVSYTDANTITISSTDTTYSTATDTVLGLIKLGSNTDQTVAANAVSTTASRTYAVQLNASDQAVVNVPWTDTDTNTDTLQTIADDSANADRFITFVSSATGAQTGLSNSSFLFNPSSGTLKGPATFTIDPAGHGDNTGTVIIAGNLTVNGTTTSVNSNEVNIGDAVILLNSDETGVPSQDAGLEIERGTSANVKVLWNEAGDRWTFTNDGTTFYNLPISSEYNFYTLPAGTTTVLGGIKLFNDTTQSVAANAVTTTASRTYGAQVNASGQAVVNVPWTDTTYSTASDTVLGLIKLGSNTDQAVAANAVTATASRTYSVQLNASDQAVVNVPWTDNDTTYSTATTSTLGLVKLGSDTQQTVAASAVTTTASRSYAVQLNASGQMLVNVPWVDTNTTYTNGDGLSLASTTFAVDSTVIRTTGDQSLAGTKTITGALQINNTSIALAPSTVAKIWTTALAVTINQNTAQTVDSWATASYRSAIYQIQITQGTEYQFGELRLMHDGTSVYLTEFAVLENGTIGTAPQPLFTAAIATGTLTLSVTIGDAATTNANMIIERKLFAV